MGKGKVFKAAIKIAVATITNKELFREIVGNVDGDFDRVNQVIAANSIDLAKTIKKQTDG